MRGEAFQKSNFFIPMPRRKSWLYVITAFVCLSVSKIILKPSEINANQAIVWEHCSQTCFGFSEQIWAGVFASVGSMQVSSGFLPLSKNTHVRMIGDSELTVGVSV